MPATLTITIPDDVLERLRQRAAAEGKSPEVLAAEDLVKSQPPVDLTGDQAQPGGLARWIGAIRSDPSIRDWADNHDKYLGEAQFETMQGRDTP